MRSRERDIVFTGKRPSTLEVHEPKVKVDMSKYALAWTLSPLRRVPCHRTRTDHTTHTHAHATAHRYTDVHTFAFDHYFSDLDDNLKVSTVPGLQRPAGLKRVGH